MEAATTPIQAITEVFTQLSSQVGISDIVAIIGVALGACAGCFLFYFGARKVTRMITKAFKSGRIGF